MKIIGIVGRAYFNKDNQKIIQVNEDIRKSLSNYEDIVPISLLPTNNDYYVNVKMGEDKLDDIDKKKLDYILDKCDGFIVPGGTYWYNFDEYIIKYAIKKDKPLLCICLGFQALCSMYANNRNSFDMTKKLNNSSHHGDERKYIHKNKILDNTKLKNILKKDTISVNSLHHDYIDLDTKELIISSYSEDNIIEAVELPNKRFVIGVEWHPEYLMDEDSIKLFDAFVNSIK